MTMNARRFSNKEKRNLKQQWQGSVDEWYKCHEWILEQQGRLEEKKDEQGNYSCNQKDIQGTQRKKTVNS